MEPIDLAVKIIKNEANDLWTRAYDHESFIQYKFGNALADTLGAFIFQVRAAVDKDDQVEFRRSLISQLKSAINELEK